MSHPFATTILCHIQQHQKLFQSFPILPFSFRSFEVWDQAEEFLLAFIEVPQFEFRLRAWHFQNSFEERPEPQTPLRRSKKTFVVAFINPILHIDIQGGGKFACKTLKHVFDFLYRGFFFSYVVSYAVGRLLWCQGFHSLESALHCVSAGCHCVLTSTCIRAMSEKFQHGLTEPCERVVWGN